MVAMMQRGLDVSVKTQALRNLLAVQEYMSWEDRFDNLILPR